MDHDFGEININLFLFQFIRFLKQKVMINHPEIL